MTRIVELPNAANLVPLQSGSPPDDFQYLDAARWTTVATDTGGANVLDEVGGVVQLDASDGSVADNDEVYLHQSAETFKILLGRTIHIRAGVKFTEANTDDANVIFGILNAWGADTLLDDGAGVKTSFSGAVFTKVDGSTLWIANSNDVGGTTKKTVLNTDRPLGDTEITAGGGTLQELEIIIKPLTSTQCDFIFKVDGVTVAKHKDQPYASAEEIAVGFGVKNGFTNEEKLDVDYVYAYETR